MITDPSLVTNRNSLLQLASSTRPNLFAKIKVTDALMESIRAGTCIDVEGLLDNDYHAFGSSPMKMNEFKRIDTVLSDSGLLCIVDYSRWANEEYAFDWKEFAISTLIPGYDRDSIIEEYPFIEWFCSSFEGSPEYEIYGKTCGNDAFGGLLIRQPAESQGSIDSDGY